MIRYFDCPLRIPWLESPTLGSDPTTPSVKSRKSMGIHDALRSNLSRGERENLVVPTVEPYCSWTNAKRVWIKIALIRIDSRSGRIRTSLDVEPGQKRGLIHASVGRAA